MRLLISVCLVLASAMDASAQATLPEMPSADSGPAKSLIRDMGGFAQGIAGECVANKPEQWEQGFAYREANIAKFKDPNEKAAWTKYLAELRAIYKSRLGGLPGVGTFAEIRAKHAQATLDMANMPEAKELPADAAQAKQLVAKVAAYTALLDGVLATYKAVYDSRCEEKLTGNWWPLKNDADKGKQAAKSLLYDLAFTEVDAINTWVGSLQQGAQEPAKDWWNHIHYAGNVLERVGKAQRFVGKLDVLAELAPQALKAYDADKFVKNVTVVREYMDKNTPLIKKLLGEVLLPKLPGTAAQAATFKKYMKDFKTGTVLGTPASRKVTTATYDEWDGGRKYTVVKKVYTSYYVWKPKTPADGTPTIEGVAPEQMCELWSRNLVSYDKGGPRHAPLKQWRGDQDILQGFMLCANKDKKSPLPYKD